MLPYIKIYPDFIEIVRELDNGARGQLFLAVMRYANDEEVTDLTGAVKIAFLTIKGQIDRDRNAYDDACERRSNAGRIAAQARWDANHANRTNRNAIDAIHAIECDSCQDKDKEKDKEEDKDKEKKSADALPDSFSPKMKETVENWFAYKREKREPYKPAGRKALITQIENNLRSYSEQDVINLIGECMANGYKGIIWDRLQRRPQKMQTAATYDLDDWEATMKNYRPVKA